MAPETDNALGFLALMAYLATLLPSNLKVVFPSFKLTAFSKSLLKNRRAIGLLVFALSTAHVYVVVHHHQLDLSEVIFYRQSISGLLILGIFALLTITSNNWSMKKLKCHWKRLHSLTYLAALLLPWHIAAKMIGKWNPITVIGIVLVAGTILLYGVRKHREGSILSILRSQQIIQNRLIQNRPGSVESKF